jgi:hypothetical protein
MVLSLGAFIRVHTATRLFCISHSLLVLVYCRFLVLSFQFFQHVQFFHLSRFCLVSFLRVFPCYFGRSNETTLPLGLSFAPIFHFFHVWAWQLYFYCAYIFSPICFFLFYLVLAVRPFTFVLTSRRFILYR